MPLLQSNDVVGDRSDVPSGVRSGHLIVKTELTVTSHTEELSVVRIPHRQVHGRHARQILQVSNLATG